MTEQEFLDMFIQERISMLLDNRAVKESKNPSDKQNEMLQAELFICSLPEREQNIIQGYIDSLIAMFAKDEPFLYQQGFFDGIRVMKFIDNL